MFEICHFQVIFTRGDGVTFIEEWEGGEQVICHQSFLPEQLFLFV